ncbi:uncharacterized protein LOC117566532 [Drosophila albomicans]|uniref:Uncharacterized protein LOC117566532 n=1 Tax=Drosophila albomicans TaxID=7291 RepID=A0A6P8WRK0_DROAB|nr:uncharacterized protein LOC117566532 [Drosophila albomicans]
MSQAMNCTKSCKHRYCVTSRTASEFNALKENIVDNTSAIQINVSELENKLKFIASVRDLPTLAEYILSNNANTNERINLIGQDLQRMKAVVDHNNCMQEMQLWKLTCEFNTAVDKYSKQRKQFSALTQRSYQADPKEELLQELNMILEEQQGMTVPPIEETLSDGNGRRCMILILIVFAVIVALIVTGIVGVYCIK